MFTYHITARAVFDILPLTGPVKVRSSEGYSNSEGYSLNKTAIDQIQSTFSPSLSATLQTAYH